MRPVSRRTLLRGAGGLAFVTGSAAVLPVFGTEGAKQTPASCPSQDLSASERELIISNWQAYIDPVSKPGSTLSEFEKQTGIGVSYSDDFTDNVEFFAKVRNQLGSCQTIERDIIVPSDWMAARMINLGWVQTLDHDNLPNVGKYLLPDLQDVAWDPDRDYSVPWQSGLTGVAYNADLVDELGSFDELLTRSDLTGKVSLLSEMRDTMGFMLKVVGADPSDFDDDEWQNAIDRLAEVRSSGQIRAFTGNEYVRDLASGNILACEAWSGDVIQLQFENPAFKFVVPEEGLSLWSDNMLVPNLATHKTNAEAWMNYYYDPMAAAKLAAWVNYICPVQGAREAMEQVDPSLVDNELIFPSAEFLADTWNLMPLSETQATVYEKDWSTVTGG